MGSGKMLNQTEIENIKKMIQEGYSVNKIAKLLSRSRTVVSNYLKDQETYGKRYVPGPKYGLTPADRQSLLREASKSTATTREIAISAGILNVDRKLRTCQRVLAEAQHFQRNRVKRKPPLLFKFVQTKGKGAAGSFKLVTSANKEPKLKSAEKKKSVKPKTVAIGEKKVKKASTDEKKIKQSAVATTKSIEKKKLEKSKVKNIKKTAVVKVKPTESKDAPPKRKVPKAKPAPATKPKRSATAKK